LKKPIDNDRNENDTMTVALAAAAASSALSAWNTPFITGSIGVVTAASLPQWQEIFSSGSGVSLPLVKMLHFLAVALSLYAARQPGRLDGYVVESPSSKSKKEKDTTRLVEDFMSLRRGGTLVAPAGWAFAIWGPIFLGELVGTAAALVAVAPGTVLASLYCRATAGFVGAQVFQTLWAATFRPKYFFIEPSSSSSSSSLAAPVDAKNKHFSMFLSAFMLAGIALSLNRAHLVYSQATTGYSLAQYLLHIMPVTLHFGWTTAAALVNLNGSLAVASSSPQVLAVAGWTSVVAATVVSVIVTVSRRAPLYGGVIAWALAACASGMTARLDERNVLIRKEQAKWFPNKNAVTAIETRKGMLGAKIQQWLCTAGSVISGVVALWTLVQRPSKVAP
jgi:hypothetical protein